jgi:DNA helicase-2/ATP-dependent DNA helicase PcrA
VGAVRYKKMFGEYMVYVNEKPILLVCDNTVFVKILDRLIWYYEHKMIEFSDIYYNGENITDKHLLKSFFLNNKTVTPAAHRLKVIETRIFDKLHKISKIRVLKLQKFISNYPEHQFQIKTLARLISI